MSADKTYVVSAIDQDGFLMVDSQRLTARGDRAAWISAVTLVFESKESALNKSMGQIPTTITVTPLGRHIGD